MPNSFHPTLEIWLNFLKKSIKNPDNQTVLVGHSLGVIAILRYLETLPQNSRIAGAVLVAGFSEPIKFEELKSFFLEPLNYRKVKQVGGKIIAIHSDNDPYVPLEQGKIMQEKLGAELIVIPNSGHLNADDGFYELPIVLESVKNIFNIK